MTVSERIIEVTIGPSGDISYRLRTSTLDTRSYGQILAQLAMQIGQMMESEGGLDRGKVVAEIAHYFAAEINAPTAQSSIHLMQ
jgi:hypothetical protein